MVHSNNAARVRLWMALKKPGGMADTFDVHMTTYPDLQSPEFMRVNPLKKVPGLIRADGVTVFGKCRLLPHRHPCFPTPLSLPPRVERDPQLLGGQVQRRRGVDEA